MICKAVFEEAESSLSRLPSPNKQYWHRDASRSPRPLTRHQPNSATERAQWPRRPAHPPKDDRRRPSFQAIALQPLSRQAQCSHGDENAIGVWHYWGFHRVDRNQELDRQKVEAWLKSTVPCRVARGVSRKNRWKKSANSLIRGHTRRLASERGEFSPNGVAIWIFASGRVKGT
jgi:hypothetical protein